MKDEVMDQLLIIIDFSNCLGPKTMHSLVGHMIRKGPRSWVSSCVQPVEGPIDRKRIKLSKVGIK